MFLRWLPILITMVLLAACGSTPLAEPPLYPGAAPATTGESSLADAMVGGFTAEIVGERNAAAVRLVRLPAGVTWDQAKRFYADRLEGTGWRADPGVLVEGDTISYAGWRNRDQLIAIAHVDDALTGAPYLALAVVRR